MNTFTLGACFQHELHTGPHLLPDYYLSDIMQVKVDGLSSRETREWNTFVFWTSESFLIIPSLRSRHLEIVGEKRTGAREGDTRGVRELWKSSQWTNFNIPHY